MPLGTVVIGKLIFLKINKYIFSSIHRIYLSYFFWKGGGSGFVGRAISRALKKIGYSVIIISRQPGLERMSWVSAIFLLQACGIEYFLFQMNDFCILRMNCNNMVYLPHVKLLLMLQDRTFLIQQDGNNNNYFKHK